MEPTERTQQLLEEIRDQQRESLAEYRKVTQQSLDLQSRGVCGETNPRSSVSNKSCDSPH
jgi:hypothetical protein